jgi:hypothetical protein
MFDVANIDGRDKGMSWRCGGALPLTAVVEQKLGLVRTTTNISSQSDLQIPS